MLREFRRDVVIENLVEPEPDRVELAKSQKRAGDQRDREQQPVEHAAHRHSPASGTSVASAASVVTGASARSIVTKSRSSDASTASSDARAARSHGQSVYRLS